LLQPTSSKFHNFSEIVRNLALKNYNYQFYEGEEVSSLYHVSSQSIVTYVFIYCIEVNFFVGAFYDGVLLLGMALNETLTEGGDLRNGAEITKKM
jgi:atrial natriuretic peptide receptor A